MTDNEAHRGKDTWRAAVVRATRAVATAGGRCARRGMPALLLGWACAALAEEPQWWRDRSVFFEPAATNDLAPVQVDQLGRMAWQAYLELEARLPGGGGEAARARVEELVHGQHPEPLRVGLLMHMAEPFHARLIEAGYADAYPWTGVAGIDTNAPARMGQLKHLFRFDPGQDTDQDGMPDWWETRRGFAVADPADAGQDRDRDGWSNAEEWTAGTDPADRFSAPRLARGVVINELLFHPRGFDRGQQWIELYAGGERPVDLGGFVIQVGDQVFTNACEIPADTRMEPGTHLLLGGAWVAYRDLEVDFTLPIRGRDGPTAAVRLAAETAGGTWVADCVMYGGGMAHFNANRLDTTGWIDAEAPDVEPGRSLSRRFPGHDTDQAADWHWTDDTRPNSRDERTDTDGDGLTDGDELTGRLNRHDGKPTDHLNRDSDGDGLDDLAECKVHGTDPNGWDTDGDIYPWPPELGGVKNWWGSDPYEIAHGWDPFDPDENTNGVSDGWEMSFKNLDGDEDGDGLSNRKEMQMNLNPRDKMSGRRRP